MRADASPLNDSVNSVGSSETTVSSGFSRIAEPPKSEVWLSWRLRPTSLSWLCTISAMVLYGAIDGMSAFTCVPGLMPAFFSRALAFFGSNLYVLASALL